MKTIVLSDCHIGSPEANIVKLNRFLLSLECNRLILAGDFWDLWDKSSSDIRRDHKGTIDLLYKLIAKGTKVEYILGNHDDSYLKDPIIPLTDVPVINKFEEAMPDGKRIAIIHGHEFDFIYQKHYWLYRVFAWVNRMAKQTVGISNNNFAKQQTCTNLKGKKYSDTVQKIHEKAQKVYKKKGFNYLIMGHTHAPMHSLERDHTCEFYNAGDWKIHNSYISIEDDKITLRYLMTDPPHEKRWFRVNEP
jgi:UDP-2,3-diacylglucosamine pyrophosphatase LpxH